MHSLIGVNKLHGAGLSDAQLQQWRPGAVVVIDDNPAEAQRLAAVLAAWGGRVIWRFWNGGPHGDDNLSEHFWHTLGGDWTAVQDAGYQRAQWMHTQIGDTAVTLASQNEPNGTPDMARALVAFELGFAAYCVEHGVQAVLCNWSVGNPHALGGIDLKPYWDLYNFIEVNPDVLALGVHEYAFRHDVEHWRGWLIDRVNHTLAQWPLMRVIVTEFGFDSDENEAHKGINNHPDPLRGMQDLAAAAKAYPDNVEVVVLFGWGDQWGEFAMHDFSRQPLDAVTALFGAVQVDEKSAPGPEPESTPEPEPEPPAEADEIAALRTRIENLEQMVVSPAFVEALAERVAAMEVMLAGLTGIWDSILEVARHENDH